MWLETMVWVWAPIACASSAWTIWRSAVTTREMRALRERVAALEARNEFLQGGRRAA
jgi:hypothetical protein